MPVNWLCALLRLQRLFLPLVGFVWDRVGESAVVFPTDESVQTINSSLSPQHPVFGLFLCVCMCEPSIKEFAVTPTVCR